MKQSLTQTITSKFLEIFKEQPIVVKSPGRINLIGEHTDYNEGFVFPAAIDKGIIAALQKSQDAVCKAVALDMNEAYEFKPNNIKPISQGGWKNYVVGIIGELEKQGITIPPFNVVFAGDVPNGAGLSSSAALENAIVFGLNELFDLGLSKQEMIFISQKAEHNYVGVRCGIMDQFASMFGVEDHALLLDCRTLKSKAFKIDFKDYQIMLINTNVSHSLVDAAYNNRRAVCEQAAAMLGVDYLRDATVETLLTIQDKLSDEDYQKALYVVQENDRVIQAGKCLEEGDLEAFGALLLKAHHGVQHQFKVSCKELDFLVEEAKQHPGVLGARMMGGGFGGCTINIVKKEDVSAFSQTVTAAYKKAFNIDCSIYFVKLSQGTHRIK